MARITIESWALSESRFHMLAHDFFEGSRIEAIGTLLLFWHDTQQREFYEGTKEEVLKFLSFLSVECREDLFNILVELEYIKRTLNGRFEISGNKKHVSNLLHMRNIASKGGRSKNYQSKSVTEENQTVSSARLADSSARLYNTIQNNTKQNTKKTKSDFDFEKVYENYPRKLGKKKGIDSCKAQIKTQAEYDSLMSAVKRYTDHCRKERTEPKYIKHFSSFMTVWTDWVAQDAGKTETAKPAFTPKFVEPSDLDKPFPESNPKVTNMISSLRNKILRGPEEPGSAS